MVFILKWILLKQFEILNCKLLKKKNLTFKQYDIIGQQ